VLIVRVLVNGDDPADLAAVAKIQNGFRLEAVSAEQFVLPDYNETSFAAVRHALLAEAQAGGGDFSPSRRAARARAVRGDAYRERNVGERNRLLHRGRAAVTASVRVHNHDQP